MAEHSKISLGKAISYILKRFYPKVLYQKIGKEAYLRGEFFLEINSIELKKSRFVMGKSKYIYTLEKIGPQERVRLKLKNVLKET